MKIVYTVLFRVCKNFYKHYFLPLVFKKEVSSTTKSASLSLSPFNHTCTSTHLSMYFYPQTDLLSST